MYRYHLLLLNVLVYTFTAHKVYLYCEIPGLATWLVVSMLYVVLKIQENYDSIHNTLHVML